MTGAIAIRPGSSAPRDSDKAVVAAPEGGQ